MSIDRRGVPDGVTIPAHLAEDDARALVDVLATHYGWAYALIGRDDVERRLAPPPLDHPGVPTHRHLTSEEWSRARATAAWTELAAVALQAVDHAEIVARTIRQAGLECVECGTALAGPPTATWGHCPTCLHRADLDALRRRPCPTAGADRPHHWTSTTCRDCGMPRIDPPCDPPRRLAAFPRAA